MKQYKNAELQIVRTNNFDIVTTSIAVGTKTVGNSDLIQAPERRKGIWD